ncbi:MAG: hypothetical protein H0T42_11750, partial [Deltaproteobacteria bacterium]|nr:hypothetical protein [Deltaproteobacteria bacterium]
MSRWPDQLISIFVIAIACLSSAGCDELDGRNRTRQGNRMFRETKFVDAVAEYERALKTVDDPIIHYNLGLAYSKVFKPGVDKPKRLGLKDTFVCDSIPNTKIVSESVCVKDGERRYDECDAKTVCASSYECKQVDLCTIEGPQLAEAAATHFQVW